MRLLPDVVVVLQHLFEIVAGAEDPAARGEDDDAHVFVDACLAYAILQCIHHRRRQRIALVGAVERQRGDAVGNIGEHKIVAHLIPL